jgi:hypothetical protein
LSTYCYRSDAPAISSDGKFFSDGDTSTDAVDTTDAKKNDEWDDAALASNLARKVTTNASAEVRDMKSLDGAKGHQGNIAEKLRMEETKAQLAAAREGMEREAKLLQEKKEEMEAKKQEVAPRFAGAASSLGGGGKWMPPSLAKMKMGAPSTGGGNRRFNVDDAELFPDLATADKIIEQKEKEQQPLYKLVKKTPVGGGASWASKKPDAFPKSDVPAEPEITAADAPIQETLPQQASSEATFATDISSHIPAKVAPIKKKKKDLSTFKHNA